MIWPAMLTGKSFSETFYRSLFAAVALLVLVMLVWGLVYGKFWAWRADVWKDKAEEAAGEAIVAQRQYRASDSAAVNATQTRIRMDAGQQDIYNAVEQAAAGVEADDDRPIDAGDRSPVRAGSLRELERAQERAGAAADRLRGARPP